MLLTSMSMIRCLSSTFLIILILNNTPQYIVRETINSRKSVKEQIQSLAAAAREPEETWHETKRTEV